MAVCSCSLVSSGLLARTSASTLCDPVWASGDATDSGAEPSCDVQQQSAQGTQYTLHTVYCLDVHVWAVRCPAAVVPALA